MRPFLGACSGYLVDPVRHAVDFERYVDYIVKLIPQAEPIQAWVSDTLRQVSTPQELRAWASQFEDHLKLHARRRVESWRKREGGGFNELPTIARLHEVRVISPQTARILDDQDAL